MAFDPQKHHRRSIRLKNYDYSSSSIYFITLCTHQRQHLFGEIHHSIMNLNPFGQIVAQEWEKSAQIRQELTLGQWVIMPNHCHAIVILDRADTPQDIPRSTTQFRMQPRSLSSLISGFKASVTRQINLIRPNSEPPIWQRNYYEIIVRNDEALSRIEHYIINNPKNWKKDSFHR